MIPDVQPRSTFSRPRLWIAALGPLLLLALLVAVIVKTKPGDSLRGDGVPPVERLAVVRAQLKFRNVGHFFLHSPASLWRCGVLPGRSALAAHCWAVGGLMGQSVPYVKDNLSL